MSDAVMSTVEQGRRLLESGRQAERAGDLAEARRCWSKALEASPNDASLFISVIESLASTGLQSEADAVLNEALDRFSSNIWVARLRPLATQRKGDWDTAVAQWHQLGDQFPKEGIVYIGLAEALRHLRRLEEAEAAVRKGMELDPGNFWTFDLYATLAEQRGNWDEAESRWQALAARFPEHGRAYLSLARIRAQAGRLDLVEKILRSGVEALPNDAELICGLVTNLLDQQNIEAAADVVRDRGDIAARNESFYPLLARAFMQFVDHPSADEFARTLVRQAWVVERQWLPAIVPPFATALARQRPHVHVAEEKLIHAARSHGDGERVSELLCLWLAPHQVTYPRQCAFVERLFRDGQVAALLALSQDAIQNGNDLSHYGIRSTIADVAHRLCDVADEQVSEGNAFARLVVASKFQPSAYQAILSRKPSAFAPVIERWFKPVDRDIAAPAVNRTRLRIAMCVSGQLRGYKEAFPTWGRFGLDQHDVRYFVHVWKGVGRKVPVSQQIDGDSQNLARAYRQFMNEFDNNLLRKWYPSLFDQGEIGEEDLKEFYGADRVVIDDDALPHFSVMANPEKMHYKIYSAGALAREHGDFDIVVRIRPDKTVLSAQGDWVDYYEFSKKHNTIFCDRGKVADANFNLMIGDQFAFGDQRLMAVYENAFKFQPESWAARLPLFGGIYQAHISLALTCFYHGIDVREADNIRFGEALEARAQSPDVLLRALEHDIGPAPRNRVDTALLDAARADVAALRASADRV